jgi:hypothetical protein
MIRCIVRFNHEWYTKELNKNKKMTLNAVDSAINGNNAKLFKLLIRYFKYVGGSDYVADAVWDKMNPKPTYHRLKKELASAKCPKLRSFGDFHECGYSKTNKNCNESKFLRKCPLPRYGMKNGKLNQMVFSVYLFLRDQCKGDFPGFVQGIVGAESLKQLKGMKEDELGSAIRNLVGEMDQIFNVGPKLANMTLSELLSVKKVKGWDYSQLFPHMVAVDTLVHEFLHRTGTLKLYGLEHKYGESVCHSQNGCVGVINNISRQIDCKRYSEEYPEYYPRMVQVCIWKFCTDSCNKNNCKYDQLDDLCEFYDWCEHLSY